MENRIQNLRKLIEQDFKDLDKQKMSIPVANPEMPYDLIESIVNKEEIDKIIDFVFEDTDLKDKDDQLFYRSFISVCMVYYRKHFHGKLDIKI
jgi:hypothetical protein